MFDFFAQAKKSTFLYKHTLWSEQRVCICKRDGSGIGACIYPSFPLKTAKVIKNVGHRDRTWIT